MKTIQPAELYEQMKAGQRVALLDVRTPVEYREVHIEGARLMPLDRLDPQAVAAGADEPVYVICRSGNRARQACEKLQAAGHGNIVHVEGGLLAWEKAGLPVTRGPKMMALERQVRIAAGSLVLLGIVLAYFSPWFLGLSAFVGAGLVFAGVTDTCGMGLLLARMPWNQVPAEPTPPQAAEAPCCSR